MHANSEIIPTILVEQKEHYENALERIGQFTKHVQLDITDGDFAESKTISLDEVTIPEGWTVDLHLMVRRPSEFLPKILELNPAMVILHAECDEELLPIFNKLKEKGLKTGLALLKPTVPETVSDLINVVGHVLIFSGDLGKMGGKASLMQLEKIRLIRKISPKVEIGWDGGANIDNVFLLSRGGVDYINVGSALAYANDPATVYENMKREVVKQSIV